MDDAALIRAVQAGDREAFGPLVDRYHGMVYSLCRRLTNGPCEAEELAHDAFVEAWLKLGQLRDPARFVGWLRMLALNLCRMSGRQARSDRIRTSQLALSGLSPDPMLTAASASSDEALRTRMSSGLARLAASHRLALALHYGEGLSCEEMGRFLSVSPGTVMSRLHRARQALKELVAQTPEEEEPAPMTEEQFKQEVQAELVLLLRLFPEKKSTRERLAVMLRRSPERLAGLIREAPEPEILESLALLLPRLGPAALGVVLGVALAGEQPAATHAHAVLRGLLNRAQPLHKQDWSPGTPAREAYWLVERLIDSPASPAARVALLLDLAPASADDAPAGLLLSTLTCWPDAAWAVLNERLNLAAGAEAVPLVVLGGLCRFGERFLHVILELLGATDPAQQELGLAGAEVFSRTLDLPSLMEASPEQRFHETRGLVHRAALFSSDLPSAPQARLRSLVAALYSGDGAGRREKALAILGQLRAADALETIGRGLDDENLPVRLAAIRALAAITEADPAHAEATGVRLMTSARASNPSEQRAAIEALARLKLPEARPLLLSLTEDSDEEVQEAAVTALGELNAPEDRSVLQALLTSGGERRRKAAVKALYRDSRPKRLPSPLEVARERRLRDGHQPFTFISLDAVMRSLPESGPYEERDLTHRIAYVCVDFAATRRYLIEKGLMTRAEGIYELTDLGRTVWRVERHIREHALA